MRAWWWLAGIACALVLAAGLASCAYQEDGQQVLFNEPRLLTRLTPGTMRGADVEALIGAPGSKIDGIVVAGNRFHQLSEQVTLPGTPAVQWVYWASRTKGIGPWPIGMNRKDSKLLTLVFDASGILRDVNHSRNHGTWERDRIISKLF